MYIKNWKCDTESSKEDFVNECPFCHIDDTCVFTGICKHQISEFNYNKKGRLKNVNCEKRN